MSVNAGNDLPDPGAVRFSDVVRDEIKEILEVTLPSRDPTLDRKAAADTNYPPETPEKEIEERGYEKRVLKAIDVCGTDLSALCLSGGGIRSATFALGVMQALARFGLLGRFHYLSSVSGGGYIASWLTAWRSVDSDANIFAALNQSMQSGAEVAQITGIRADSNYLTPQLGLLSADSWTLVTLYIRNLVLNWILFVPFFMGCFFFPRMCAGILRLVAEIPHPTEYVEWGGKPGIVFMGLGGLCLILGLGFGIYGRFRREGSWLTKGAFLLRVLLFLVLSGALFTLAAVAIGRAGPVPSTGNLLLRGALFGAVAYFAAWAFGRFLSRSVTDVEEKEVEKLDVVFWTISGALVGMLAAVGIGIIAAQICAQASDTAREAITVMGLSGFVLAYLAGDLCYVGLASLSHKSDMDREWLARSSGWLSATAVGWAVFSAVALLVPDGLQAGHPLARTLTVLGSLISGAVTGSLGWSNLTAATKAAQTLKNVPLMLIASIAAVIFAVLTTSLLALLDFNLELLVEQWIPALGSVPALIDLALLFILIGLAAALSLAINVNRFSLHALYRNRLVRAFLGSARAMQRKPDPFTGFDHRDNLRFAKLTPHDGTRLFHVINAALNAVSSSNRAWQERKAESFTMTRQHCGNPLVHYRPTKDYGGRNKGGLTIGTAMAISGAAVSPNQGYNSSPLIGFLLMLFNVRLGWWLGSPRKGGYFREGPQFSLSAALRELAGDTSDDSKWIYLSDGGHFENLGLYEMVRRRCRRIVVSDAGCDPDFNFEDLGNAVRKIYIDLGVSIQFEKLEIKARQNPPVPGLRFAIGSIHYPGSAQPGWLLYLKPTYQQTNERADIRSYAIAHSQFPHESTTDQWFSESQLESYRALGANVTEYICSGGSGIPPGTEPETLDLDSLQRVAATLMERDVAQASATHCCKCPSGARA